MAESYYRPKPLKTMRLVETVTVAPGSTANVLIPRDIVQSEIVLGCVSTVTAATTAPTAYDPSQAMTMIRLQGSREEYASDGAGVYYQCNFFESQPVVTLSTSGTTSTAGWQVELHREMDESDWDLMTAPLTPSLSGNTLTISAAPSGAGWSGYAGALSAESITVHVYVEGYPSLTAEVSEFRQIAATLDEGQVEDYVLGSGIGALATVGVATHVFRGIGEKTFTDATNTTFSLDTLGKTRALFVIVDDVTGGSHVAYRDDVVAILDLSIAGEQYVTQLTWGDLQRRNAASRNSWTGVAVIDFGDFFAGFLDTGLPKNVSAKLQLQIGAMPAGVTTARVRVYQDYMID